MNDVAIPLVAIVGFKRNRFAPLGGMRVLTVRDGVVRLQGKNGTDLESEVAALTARLTRTRTVRLESAAGSAYIYGFAQLSKLPDALSQIVIRESAGAELIGPCPPGALGVMSPKNVTGAAKVSRALADALHERGVG